MDYKKLIVNIQSKEMSTIQKACEVDKRTLASLTRKVLLKEAERILQENEK